MPGETPDTLRDLLEREFPNRAGRIIDVLRMYAARSSADVREVLGLLGLNTREGWMLEWQTREGVQGWAVDPYMTGLEGEPDEGDVPVLVVLLPSGPATKEDNDA